MQEYVLHTMGIEAMPTHLTEAKEIGFDTVEISDNIIDLGESTRDKLIKMVQAAGLGLGYADPLSLM